MKIYTKTGDGGETGLYGGERRPKDDARIAAYGDIDELQSVLGLVIAHMGDPVFKDVLSMCDHIQRKGFVVAGQLAGAFPSKDSPGIDGSDVEWLQTCIDSLDASLPQLRDFILPGGGLLAAHLHLARTVCRRAERSVVTLQQKETVSPILVRYLNRLSDLLFVMARTANHRQGTPDQIWKDSVDSDQAG